MPTDEPSSLASSSSDRPEPAASETTKQALLDAAERLIAQHGVDAASVRAITEAAGANLAAVSYHFGSKNGLVRSVFERRLVPINRQRLELLDDCLEAPGTPDLECIVEAFVLPPLQILRREHAPDFGRCMIRALADPGDQMRALLTEAFEGLIERFAEALRRALPEAEPEGIFWRFHFMVGAMAYTLGMGHLVEEYSHGICSCADLEQTGKRLVRFIAAGMRAEIEGATA